MMAAQQQDRLPSIRGRYSFNEPLAPYTTLKIGGPAEIWLQPQDFDDLCAFLASFPQDMGLTVVGEGSNIMVRDGGIPGVVLKLGKGLDAVHVSGNEIYAEAGATSGKVARAAREAGLTGAEFLCGIPGSVGGALKMNAGAYGRETAQILKAVEVITDKGEIQRMQPEALGFGYRHSNLPDGWLFKAAHFVLQPGEKDDIRAAMRQVNRDRSTSQPLNMPSSGSWFKNVIREDGSKWNAWKIVDEAGCRGMHLGQAQVSEKHSNFFVNLGGATAADMEALSAQVEEIIKQKLGVTMQREVKILGVPA